MPKRTRTSSVRRPFFKRRRYLLSLAVFVIVAGFIVWLWHNHNSPKVSAPSSPVTSLPQQSVANDKKNTANTPSSTVNQGGASDNNGQVPANTSGSPNQWATSSSGLITLKSPLQNSIFKSGDSIYGSASTGPVQFRLIDNQVGVIAQGTINVVNGSFSATASFKPYASSGRLDVFNTDPNGKEINEVQIPVNF